MLDSKTGIEPIRIGHARALSRVCKVTPLKASADGRKMQPDVPSNRRRAIEKNRTDSREPARFQVDIYVTVSS
jgi:hypothetical protein